MYTFETTGNTIDLNQLKEEMKACNVCVSKETILVRWQHCDLGIVFDTVEDYRKFNGIETKISDLDTFQPSFINTL